MSEKLVIWLAILGLILLSILCICNKSEKIETDLLGRSLSSIENVDGFDGNVEISGRDITLNGLVDSEDFKLKLEQLIGSELGVRKVINNITIKSPEVLKEEIREEVQEALNKVIEFDNIEFQSNTAIILDESFNLLDETAVILTENSDLSIEIGGHSDSAGNEDYNIGLSQRRADAVLIALVNRGVERSRLLAVGYGSSQSIADNDTDEGKQKNRRVEFKIKENM